MKEVLASVRRSDESKTLVGLSFDRASRRRHKNTFSSPSVFKLRPVIQMISAVRILRSGTRSVQSLVRLSMLLQLGERLPHIVVSGVQVLSRNMVA